MSTLELKTEIHKKINAMDNVSELIDFNLSLDWFMQEKLTDSATSFQQLIRYFKYFKA